MFIIINNYQVRIENIVYITAPSPRGQWIHGTGDIWIPHTSMDMRMFYGLLCLFLLDIEEYQKVPVRYHWSMINDVIEMYIPRN